MKMVLTAGDYAQSETLTALAGELTRCGYICKTFFAFGQEIKFPLAEVADAVRAADAAIVAICDNNSGDVTAAHVAMENGRPLILLSTGHHSIQHRAYAPFRGYARSILLSAYGKKQAEALFPNAAVAIVGDPIWEQDVFLEHTPDQAREILDLSPTEKVVLVILDRCDTGNMSDRRAVTRNTFLAASVFEACRRLKFSGTDLRFLGTETSVIFTPHPGDRYGYGTNPDFYRNLVFGLGKFAEIPARIVEKNILPTREIVPVAALTIHNFSTIDVASAYAGIPTICFQDALSREYLLEKFGRDDWPPAEDGVTERVSGGPNELFEAMERLFTPEGYAPMRRRQFEVFPRPSRKGEITERMADTVLSVLQ